jgi:hypothetical protein
MTDRNKKMANKTMLAKTKSLLRLLFWGLPISGDYLARRYLKKQYRVEIELIKSNHINENNHRSIIHFSMNKAATQYVRGLLERSATEIGMVTVGLGEYAFHTNFPYLDDLSVSEIEKYQYLFKPTGYLYSVFGGMIEGISDLEKYLVVLMIRDPRDILVSEYYSYGYSHAVPLKRGNKYDKFMKMRRMARQLTVDEYVIGESDRLYNTYQRYIRLLVNRYPLVYVTKYEDMTSDFGVWLGNLLDHCELKVSSGLLRSFFEESKKLQPKKEDVYQHNRKGMPGDYREKLKQETIDNLNLRFSPVLEKFDFI